LIDQHTSNFYSDVCTKVTQQTPILFIRKTTCRCLETQLCLIGKVHEDSISGWHNYCNTVTHKETVWLFTETIV